jgi:pimeloyl-ACP methyl ester carboxylesterase
MTPAVPTGHERGATVTVNGVRIHYEEQGSGVPILCIHGAGSSALAWGEAVAQLAHHGRVIAYDRRGCARSDRPDPYERTSVREHGADAAALLGALGAEPAIVIGRSYGGTVATDLALRHPDRVRALILLEADATRDLAPATAAWIDGISERVREVAATSGVGMVGEALIDEVLGEGTWPVLPERLRDILTDNGPAILAELSGEWWLDADAAELAELKVPALLVAATDSRPELREPTEALAAVLPDAHLVRVAGGHLIDPASPEVLAFVDAVSDGP